MELKNSIAFQSKIVQNWNEYLFKMDHGTVIFLPDYAPLAYPEDDFALCFLTAVLNLYRFLYDDKCLYKFLGNQGNAMQGIENHRMFCNQISHCRSWFCHNNVVAERNRRNSNFQSLRQMGGAVDWKMADWADACKRLEDMVSKETEWLDDFVSKVGKIESLQLEKVRNAVCGQRFYFDRDSSPKRIHPKLLVSVTFQKARCDKKGTPRRDAKRQVQSWLCSSPEYAGCVASASNKRGAIILQECRVHAMIDTLTSTQQYEQTVIAKCLRDLLHTNDDFRKDYNKMLYSI